MEQLAVFKEAGRNRQLTERDRELCGFLAVCRYLTREQVERLMFPGRSKARSSTRLRQLAASVGGQAAVLRGDLGFGSADGWTTVWALTPEGFEIGSQRLGLKLERVPKHDVGQAFLKHEVLANESLPRPVGAIGRTNGGFGSDSDSSVTSAEALLLAWPADQAGNEDDDGSPPRRRTVLIWNGPSSRRPSGQVWHHEAREIPEVSATDA